jgi:CRISPR/Cas system CSM-associated protein Csm3 (group 7 of RAMP superfamily)
MHKRLYNEAIIRLTISPDGPILIKAGEKGADPTRPDMEFVRTHHGGNISIYLPGSSLKGAFRAHCERIARTVGGERLACNPLDSRNSCSARLEGKKLNGAGAYRQSCRICQLFGNTSIASHLRVTDGSPQGQVVTEERNGVAIDRVFGSVAVGPFNYEVCTKGDFQTTLYVKNFTVGQLGLLALALRDLEAGLVGVGFAKSRGLGRVNARIDSLVVRYPVCQQQNGSLVLLGSGERAGRSDQLLGLGRFLLGDELSDYGCQANDWAALPQGLNYGDNEWGEVELHLDDTNMIKGLWRNCIFQWREVAGL